MIKESMNFLFAWKQRPNKYCQVKIMVVQQAKYSFQDESMTS